MRIKHLGYLAGALLLASAGAGLAQDTNIVVNTWTVGTRGGISFDNDIGRFKQVEVFADMNLPWAWNFYSDWRFQPRVEATAGWLNGEDTDAFVGGLGPMLELHKGNFPLFLVGGSNFTLLSRDKFGRENFGDLFQFTTHVGVTWQITRNIAVGYRFQHMSNAGIASPNPGLNEQMLEASYSF